MKTTKSLFIAIGLLCATNVSAHFEDSPYVYCHNNPVNAIDPDGRDVVILGPLSNEALAQIQNRVGNSLSLTLINNFMCYSITGEGKLNSAAKKVIKMIDNCDITVNLETRNSSQTSTGNLFIGGVFMGNNVELDKDGNVQSVTANQEINPNVLGKADKFSKEGTFVMHELTEAYEGAKISQTKKVSSPKSNEEGSFYQKAHNKATVQPPVYQKILDINGNITNNVQEAARVEWYVKPSPNSTKENIIQAIP